MISVAAVYDRRINSSGAHSAALHDLKRDSPSVVFQMQMREKDVDPNSFARRHIGPTGDEVRARLREVGFENLDALIDAAIPKNIRLDRRLDLPEAKSESEALADLHALAKKNKVTRSFIGAGYSDCITPPVIQRNVLENPGW
jgi:glycine dehydrogenase